MPAKRIPPLALPIAAVVLMGVGFALIPNCSRPGSGAVGVVYQADTPDQRMALSKQAVATSSRGLTKASVGEPLEPEDKADLQRAADMDMAILDADPNAFAVYYNLGSVLEILGQRKQALRDLQQYVLSDARKEPNLRPSIADAYYVSSRIQFVDQDYRASVASAEEAIKMYPKVANYLAARASSLIQLGRFDDARKDLAGALKIDPKHIISLGLMKLIKGKSG